jgi:hypothetical protein
MHALHHLVQVSESLCFGWLERYPPSLDETDASLAPAELRNDIDLRQTGSAPESAEPAARGPVSSVEVTLQAPGLLLRLAESFTGLLELLIKPHEVGLEIGNPVLVRVEQLLGLVALDLSFGVGLRPVGSWLDTRWLPVRPTVG